MSDNLSIGPFVLTLAPRSLRFGEQLVELEPPALEVLAEIARSTGGVAARQLWPLASSEAAVDEDALCELVGDINNALGRWSPAWYVAWYPEDAVPRFALVDATRRESPMAALPARRTDIIGRDETIARVIAQLDARRFVTILAAGGMGKTTVALAAAHVAADRHPDGVHFVDLSPIVDDGLVAQGVATALGCAAEGAAALPALQRWARDRRALVVLDSCEHVVDAAAAVAEALLGAGPTLAVLATSREPLRAAGEWLHRLPPMRLPQPGEATSARQALEFPALRLFVERASAADSAFVLHDAEVPLLVSVCTRLDGIALAIEIVAARVDTLGLAALAGQLEGLLLRLPVRRRNAPPRHNTLFALLDWSFQLLSPAERQVLRRLSVFRNGFTLDAATEIIADPDVDAAQVREGMLDLIAKSLVAPARGADTERLRLLDTTRAFASARLEDAGERDQVRRRHAMWVAATLAGAERSWNRMTRSQWVERYAPLIDDVRAALDWAFAPGGDIALGAGLTISGFALGRQMLLADEFTRRAEQAIEALATRGAKPVPGEAGAASDSLRLRLNVLVGCLGAGQVARTPGVASALESAAATFPDATGMLDRFAAFNGMWGLAVARGDFRAAATWSDRLAQLTAVSDDPVAQLIAGRIQAQTLHFAGRHAQAIETAQRVIDEAWRTIPLSYNPSPVELRVSMRVVLARALWMQGFPDRAAAMAQEAMEQSRTDSPLAQYQAIVMGSIVVALWGGMDKTARQLSTRLIDVEPIQGFGLWLSWGKRFREVVALRSGEDVASMRDPGYFDEPDPLLADHLATMDERWLSATCIHRVATASIGWCAPEVLRRQGERTLIAKTASTVEDGEALLQRSLAVAREQRASSWELRTATSLARHWLAHDRAPEARALLEPVFTRFTEGFATADLLAARDLLARM